MNTDTESQSVVDREGSESFNGESREIRESINGVRRSMDTYERHAHGSFDDNLREDETGTTTESAGSTEGDLDFDFVNKVCLIASAKRHDVEPLAYLTDVFTRLPATPVSQLEQFLPDRWQPRDGR